MTHASPASPPDRGDFPSMPPAPPDPYGGCYGGRTDDGGTAPTFPVPQNPSGSILNLAPQSFSTQRTLPDGPYPFRYPEPAPELSPQDSYDYNTSLLRGFTAPGLYPAPLDDDPHGLKLFHFINYGIAHPNPFNNPIFASILSQDQTLQDVFGPQPQPHQPDGILNLDASGGDDGKDSGDNNADGATPVPSDGGTSLPGDGGTPAPGQDGSGPSPYPTIYGHVEADGGLPSQTSLPPADGGDGSILVHGPANDGDGGPINPPVAVSQSHYINPLVQAMIAEMARNNADVQGENPMTQSINPPYLASATSSGPPLSQASIFHQAGGPFGTQPPITDVNPGSLYHQMGMAQSQPGMPFGAVHVPSQG